MTKDGAERAAELGIETEYRDGLGRRRVVDAEALARIAAAMGREGHPSRLQVSVRERAESGEANLPIAPQRCWQGASDDRLWMLAVQLYGVRSRRNWGHGDFTDLCGLVDLAADRGAAGIGLNPLHAPFDAGPSPYSPNSRLYLNPRYIDVEAVAEFPGLRAAGLEDQVAALRRADLVDYYGVAVAKEKALRLSYEVFRRSAGGKRAREFENFRREAGAPLARFACFEWLRKQFAPPWSEWPSPWRRPDEDPLKELRAGNEEAIGYFEFVQWIAQEQLENCRSRAAARGLPIGLYLDIAVGARADGYDAWSEQDAILSSLELGAPPDMLNTAGQKWGIAGTSPVGLAARGFEPFRGVLRAAMRYAGAIRLDHVMGLERQFLVPCEMPAERGTYVRFPFRALLAVTAQESVAHRSIVIGEDLGTVPENFRETLAASGIWSYQVMIFEREKDGAFRAPQNYRGSALATFSTHDLPTFAGWIEGADLSLKRALGIDPGETDAERRTGVAALAHALAGRGLVPLPPRSETQAKRSAGEGARPGLDPASAVEGRNPDFLSVARYLAATPSRLLVISMEDALGIAEQVNVPGTVDEHPNWRRRLPVAAEDLAHEPRLAALAEAMAAEGRSVQGIERT